MFSFPALWLLFLSAAETAAYFVMLMPRFDLKLWKFLCISLAFTAAVGVLWLFVGGGWIWYGGVQALLCDVGAAAHMLNGKRSMRDVVGKK